MSVRSERPGCPQGSPVSVGLANHNAKLLEMFMQGNRQNYSKLAQEPD